MPTRLNKYLSEIGYCSRREADKLIEQGVVFVNGQQATIGDKVDDRSRIEINGQPINTDNQFVYVVLNKPRGITSTTDLKDKTNIIEFINYPKRIFPIGRLDKDSEGLILLTNDGDIVNKILRSGNHHEKEYIVMVDKPITTAFIKQMRNGVDILDTKTKPAKVQQLNKKTFSIILTEGLNRQIRRMCSALGYRVFRLVRVRIMNITDHKLERGQWRHLTKEEVSTLKQLTKHSKKTV